MQDHGALTKAGSDTARHIVSSPGAARSESRWVPGFAAHRTYLRVLGMTSRRAGILAGAAVLVIGGVMTVIVALRA
jgi:hypothetical protein